MILDTSAIVAISLKEPDHTQFVEKVVAARRIGVGAPTLIETGMVLTAKMGSDARSYLDNFVSQVSAIIIPFDEPHYRVAIDAWMRFGKGNHPAALNFGDCVSYATARVAREPLLCKGNDFSATDLTIA